MPVAESMGVEHLLAVDMIQRRRQDVRYWLSRGGGTTCMENGQDKREVRARGIRQVKAKE